MPSIEGGYPLSPPTMISITSEAATAIASSTGGVVSGLWYAIFYLLAIPLAFYIIKRVIQMFPKR